MWPCWISSVQAGTLRTARAVRLTACLRRADGVDLSAERAHPRTPRPSSGGETSDSWAGREVWPEENLGQKKAVGESGCWRVSSRTALTAVPAIRFGNSLREE